MSEKIVTGKYLAYILRHNPAAAEIELDANGWANVKELLCGIKISGRQIDMAALKAIVETDNKGRFSFDGDKSKIRAVQGHSVAVDLQLKEKIPPDILYHGTADKYLWNIQKDGLIKKSRNFVHLSADQEMARKVGNRYGKPVILAVQAGKMAADGFVFFQAENDVWLTNNVPAEYLAIEG